jgi:ArsR family transcriptional regulator
MATSTSMMLWMQSLSDQTRVRLLRLLEKNELTVVELCSILQLPQSTVSRHLKHLADDGWIGSRRDGTSNLYRMHAAELDAAQRRLWSLVRDQGMEPTIAEQDESRLAEVLAARRSRSQAFFSTASGQWDHLRREMFGHRIDGWAMASLLEPGSVVGDLGCGTGGLTQMMAPWAKRVIAVDSSSAMLQAAARRLKECEHVEVRRGELTALPIDDAELHLALLVLVLPYVESPSQVFLEASRATRTGGRLVLLDMLPHNRAQYREELGHTWLGFHEKQLRDWLLESGWRPLRWQPLPPEPDAKGPGLFVMTATKV